MRLRERQAEFAAALLDPVRPVPHGLVGPDGKSSPKRFSTYRNNVVASLIKSLEASFPAVSRIVGGDFFRAMARAYVAVEPPTSPIMLEYGDGFAAFVAHFKPAASLPYLSDVAAIERAWVEAYHAPEALALEPEALASVSTERVSDIQFAVHPSVRVIRSSYPALTIWQMNVRGGDPEPIDFKAGGEDTLIARPVAEVEVRLLPPGGAQFVTALANGAVLSEATEAALSSDRTFELALNLSGLIRAGILTGYSIRNDDEEPHTQRDGL